MTSGGKGDRDWALQRILNKGIQSARRLVLCGGGVPFALSHAQVTLSSSEKDELSALPVQVRPAPGSELGEPGQEKTLGTGSPLWVLFKVSDFSPKSAACFLESSGSCVLSRGCTEHGHVLLRGWHWGFHGRWCWGSFTDKTILTKSFWTWKCTARDVRLLRSLGRQPKVAVHY